MLIIFKSHFPVPEYIFQNKFQMFPVGISLSQIFYIGPRELMLMNGSNESGEQTYRRTRLTFLNGQAVTFATD